MTNPVLAATLDMIAARLCLAACWLYLKSGDTASAVRCASVIAKKHEEGN